MNLFGTILTYTAPSANYRGESAENRAVIQKITKGRFEYAIISPEAMRNALRETLRNLGLPCNRTRLPNEKELAVCFEDYPDAAKYADDFFMGWLIAVGEADRKRIKEDPKNKKRYPDGFPFKGDSVLRMNMAMALEPYRHDSVFTQSPLNMNSPWKNAEQSALLHRETTVTAFQYPFALNLQECSAKPEWTKTLLRAIGELNAVAGNHARSYFEMAPASIVVRLTNQLVAGFNTYGFSIGEDSRHNLTEVTDGIAKDDYPGTEFYLGGKIVKDMDEARAKAVAEKDAHPGRNPQAADEAPKTIYDILVEKGVHVNRNPQRLLEQVGGDAFPSKK